MKEPGLLDKQIGIIDNAIHRMLFEMIRPNEDMEILKDLTFLDLHIISMAHDKPDRILKEIKDSLHIPQTTLSSSVSKLEKVGFIRRVINRRDLRSFSIELTEKGKEILEEHISMDRRRAKRILMLLDEEERKEFVALLQKIFSGS